MRKLYLALALVCIFISVAAAQKPVAPGPDKPDLTGSWEMAEPKGSTYRSLVITQSGDVLTLVESREHKGRLISNKAVLYADQRGEKNLVVIPGADGPAEVDSKTTWKKDKLVRRSTINEIHRNNREEYRVSHTTVETYSKSKDGDKLTVDTIFSRTNPWGDPGLRTAKRSYIRKN